MNQTSIYKIRRSKNIRIKENQRRREKLSIQIFDVESMVVQFIQSLVQSNPPQWSLLRLC